MTTTTIEKKLILSPSVLSSPNLQSTLKEFLEKKEIGTCTKETGYIINITNDDIIIKDNKVLNNGKIEFLVQYFATVFKPEINDLIYARVISVSYSGIFLENSGFIPGAKLKINNYIYDPAVSIFRNGKKSLKVKDVLKVKITNIIYETRKYTYLCNLEK